MTVAELIEKLSTLPANAVVLVDVDSGSSYFGVNFYGASAIRPATVAATATGWTVAEKGVPAVVVGA